MRDSERDLGRLVEPMFTSLPASPEDGQVINYLADATAGVAWRLRYRAASASIYKWEFIGGPVLQVGPAGDYNTYSGGANADLPGGPTLTIALAGVYVCYVRCSIVPNTTSTSGYGSAFMIGGASQQLAAFSFINGGGDGSSQNLATVATAGTAVKMQVGSANLQPIRYVNGVIGITPVRVG